MNKTGVKRSAWSSRSIRHMPRILCTAGSRRDHEFRQAASDSGSGPMRPAVLLCAQACRGDLAHPRVVKDVVIDLCLVTSSKPAELLRSIRSSSKDCRQTECHAASTPRDRVAPFSRPGRHGWIRRSAPRRLPLVISAGLAIGELAGRCTRSKGAAIVNRISLLRLGRDQNFDQAPN